MSHTGCNTGLMRGWDGHIVYKSIPVVGLHYHFRAPYLVPAQYLVLNMWRLNSATFLLRTFDCYILGSVDNIRYLKGRCTPDTQGYILLFLVYL